MRLFKYKNIERKILSSTPNYTNTHTHTTLSFVSYFKLTKLASFENPSKFKEFRPKKGSLSQSIDLWEFNIAKRNILLRNSNDAM